MTLTNITPNRALNDVIGSLKIRCISTRANCSFDAGVFAMETHEKPSCSWIGHARDVESHYSVCSMAIVSCPHPSCQSNMPRYQLEGHQASCMYREVVCEHCGYSTPMNTAAIHMESCAKRLVACVLCHQTFPCDLEEQHRSAHCPMEQIACCFAQMGCGVRLPRGEMVAHMADVASHTAFLLSTIQNLQKENVSLTTKYQTVLQQVEGAKVAFVRQREDMWDLRLQYDALQAVNDGLASRLSSQETRSSMMEECICDLLLLVKGSRQVQKSVVCEGGPRVAKQEKEISFKIHTNDVCHEFVDSMYFVLNGLPGHWYLRLRRERDLHGGWTGYHFIYLFPVDIRTADVPLDVRCVFKLVSQLPSVDDIVEYCSTTFLKEDFELGSGHGWMFVESRRLLKPAYFQDNGILTIDAKFSIRACMLMK